MQGRGGPGARGGGDDEEERRRRQVQRGGAPGADAPQLGDYLAAGAVAATALGLAFGAYKIYGALTGGQTQEDQHRTTVSSQSSNSYSWTSAISGLFSKQALRSSFWRNVEEAELEAGIPVEVSFQRNVEEAELEAGIPVESEAVYKHRHNKLDKWFQKLLANVLRINPDERHEFVEAFSEIIDVLLEEMEKADPLFKYMFRTYRPAGSSWEDLRICIPDEFDVNLILLPTDIQQNIEVEDNGSGHISMRLDNGFDVPEHKVLKKFNNDPKFPSYYESIKAQLKNWVENSYVSRSKVMQWLQRVVDLALLRLKGHQWHHVQKISRSTFGPAVTIIATMKNGKQFSIDLVPAFEFSQGHLPPTTYAKVRAKGSSRTWYAIPKGPTKESPTRIWRTSLYEAERDLMKGQYHLKPCIRIMKRLRDVQKWDKIASYYLKTKFMWMMDEHVLQQGMGLGQLVMLAMKSFEDALQKCQINYYWDDELNLLDQSNKVFYKDASGCLTRIIKQFEKSVDDNTDPPMRYFGQ